MSILQYLREELNNIEDNSYDKFFDDNYSTREDLVNGLKSGKLLVHARVKDGTDFKYGIYPSAGDWLRSTEAWQTSVEYYDEGPELTFFSDGKQSSGEEVKSWGKGIAQNRKVPEDKIELIWVEKQPSIIQNIGNGKVRTYDNKIIPYYKSDMADHESDLYRDVPAGVETNDWFTNDTVDVAAVTDNFM